MKHSTAAAVFAVIFMVALYLRDIALVVMVATGADPIVARRALDPDVVCTSSIRSDELQPALTDHERALLGKR